MGLIAVGLIYKHGDLTISMSVAIFFNSDAFRQTLPRPHETGKIINRPQSSRRISCERLCILRDLCIKK